MLLDDGVGDREAEALARGAVGIEAMEDVENLRLVLGCNAEAFEQRAERGFSGQRVLLMPIEETEGKIACLWMIGEYGQLIDDELYYALSRFAAGRRP